MTQQQTGEQFRHNRAENPILTENDIDAWLSVLPYTEALHAPENKYVALQRADTIRGVFTELGGKSSSSSGLFEKAHELLFDAIVSSLEVGNNVVYGYGRPYITRKLEYSFYNLGWDVEKRPEADNRKPRPDYQRLQDAIESPQHAKELRKLHMAEQNEQKLFDMRELTSNPELLPELMVGLLGFLAVNRTTKNQIERNLYGVDFHLTAASLFILHYDLARSLPQSSKFRVASPMLAKALSFYDLEIVNRYAMSRHAADKRRELSPDIPDLPAVTLGKALDAAAFVAQFERNRINSEEFIEGEVVTS